MLDGLAKKLSNAARSTSDTFVGVERLGRSRSVLVPERFDGVADCQAAHTVERELQAQRPRDERFERFA